MGKGYIWETKEKQAESHDIYRVAWLKREKNEIDIWEIGETKEYLFYF